MTTERRRAAALVKALIGDAQSTKADIEEVLAYAADIRAEVVKQCAEIADGFRCAGHDENCGCPLCGNARAVKKAIRALWAEADAPICDGITSSLQTTGEGLLAIGRDDVAYAPCVPIQAVGRSQEP